MGETPELSVIVPTRNRPRQLAALLGSLARQAEASSIGWELVVVDDAGSEATRKRLDAIFSRWREAPLTLVRLGDRGWPGRARNLGAARSRGKVLVFIDDDLVLEERALAEIRGVLAAHPEVEVLNGQLRKLREDYYSDFWHYYYDAVFNRKPAAPGPYTIPRVGGLVAVRRGLLERLWPLYDETLPAREDFDLYLRLRRAGIPSYKDDRIIAYHDFRRSWWAMVRQRIWYAQGEWALEQKYGTAYLEEIYRSEPAIPRQGRFLPLYLSSFLARRLWRTWQAFQIGWARGAVDRRSHS